MCTVWRENEACERAMTEGAEKWRKCNRSSGQLTRVVGRRGSSHSFNHKDVCAVPPRMRIPKKSDQRTLDSVRECRVQSTQKRGGMEENGTKSGSTDSREGQ